MKVCRHCGATENATKILGDLCRKHYLQLYRHGKFLERTIYDENEIIVEGDVAKIILRGKNGEYRGEALIDVEDVSKVKNIKWYFRNGYVRGSTPDGKVFLHRVVLGTSDDKITDHRNGNGLDNRKANLRECVHRENSKNIRRKGKKISGVTQLPSGNWVARITVDYKSIWIGVFPTEALAIDARLSAEEKYFGEFSPHADSYNAE